MFANEIYIVAMRHDAEGAHQSFPDVWSSRNSTPRPQIELEENQRHNPLKNPMIEAFNELYSKAHMTKPTMLDLMCNAGPSFMKYLAAKCNSDRGTHFRSINLT